jgi:hypothetical protein
VLKKTVISMCLLFMPFLTPIIKADHGHGSRVGAVHRIPLQWADPLDDQELITVSPEDEESLFPFSPRRTCCQCHVSKHDYTIISQGWHFNAMDPNCPTGRPGEPWIYADPALGLQIPLSYRRWAGTFIPDQIGLSPLQFTYLFGRQLPGGGPGEVQSDSLDDINRQLVSGLLEINCLACHNAHHGQDMAEYAQQVSRQNLRWAAAAACEFASVEGSARDMPDTFDPFMPDMLEDTRKIPPTIAYQEGIFDKKDRVLFDLVREVPNQRCYYCHATQIVSNPAKETWQVDEDVHLAAGLTCVDCHREGLSHDTIRGYEGEPSKNPEAPTMTCRGCHLGFDGIRPVAGRLGAPRPLHKGIPAIHFDKLSCTACHSGPWPSRDTVLGHTARAHALGTHGLKPSDQALPRIHFPVFSRQDNGKITPCKLLWPAYWARLDDDQNVTPLPLETIAHSIGALLSARPPGATDGWQALEPNDVKQGLTVLATNQSKPVYVAGGILFRLNDANSLVEEVDHPAAQPYLWPLAHDVRPAAQSLGLRGCEDCHAEDAPFMFGQVVIDSPVESEQTAVYPMIRLQQLDPGLARRFARTFVFRPWLKLTLLVACALIALILLAFGLRALVCLSRASQ